MYQLRRRNRTGLLIATWPPQQATSDAVGTKSICRNSLGYCETLTFNWNYLHALGTSERCFQVLSVIWMNWSVLLSFVMFSSQTVFTAFSQRYNNKRKREHQHQHPHCQTTAANIPILNIISININIIIIFIITPVTVLHLPACVLKRIMNPQRGHDCN